MTNDGARDTASMPASPDVLDELLPLFQSECEERLNAISTSLAAIEEFSSAAERAVLVDRLLRELHSLKGGARAVNLATVESVSHAFEQVLVRIQRDELDWCGEVLDACHQSVAALAELVGQSNDAGRPSGEEIVSLLEGLQRTPVAPPPAAVEEVPLSPEEQEMLRKLLPVFRAEAEERLEAIGSALDELRSEALTLERRNELFESVMRDAHSLKGGSRTMKLAHASAVCQKFEAAAARLMRGELQPYPDLYDLFERAADLVQGLLESPEHLNEGLVHRMIEDLAAVGDPRVAAAPQPQPLQPSLTVGPSVKPALAARASQTVRVATEKLDSVLRQSQEMLVAKLAMRERAADIRELAALLREWQAEWSRVDTDVYRLQSWVEKHDQHSDPAGIYPLAASATRFLEWSQKSVRSLDKHVRQLSKRLFEDQQAFGIMVDTLVDETKRALMLPLSTLFKGLPRMVREVARVQKKVLDFEVRGDDVEVDKRILDEMRDPLMHLLRNCVDHGIEAADERMSRGKQRRGRIAIDVTQTAADRVELLVCDDGRGIDTEQVRVAAVRNGVLTEAQSTMLEPAEVLQLVFLSGVSTSQSVSNISGRGLGMAICREGVERLGGAIVIDSEIGKGTSFRITLPLALATYRVLLLQIGDHILAVPTANADRVIRLSPGSVTRIDGKDAITDRGTPILLEDLDRVLGLDRQRRGASRRPVAAILRSGGRRVAFAVDRVLDEQEVLFKDLGSYLVHVPNVAGSTILGTGKVVPILNAPEMIDAAYAENIVVARAPEAAQPAELAHAAPRSILVVEDSITSRMLLKDILESAGYVVSTAINGAEAVGALERERFDLVVSDVEMPRMNGFELTESIRADERWPDLPVILITGLERDDQRARGLAAGANEYIVKGSFEQSNLLEAIRRLCGAS
jgi:two-component system chemotaxis sensor kinase CheA